MGDIIYLPSTTNRGGPQGQIGSDFIFSLVNDGINPEHVFDEITLRTKYVDDLTDIYSHDTVSGVFRSLKHNEALLMKHATSTGLKLNLDKLKIIPLNIKFDELDPTYPYLVENQYIQIMLPFLGIVSK